MLGEGGPAGGVGTTAGVVCGLLRVSTGVEFTGCKRMSELDCAEALLSACCGFGLGRGVDNNTSEVLELLSVFGFGLNTFELDGKALDRRLSVEDVNADSSSCDSRLSLKLTLSCFFCIQGGVLAAGSSCHSSVLVIF